MEPRTEASASMFCGGTLPFPASRVTETDIRRRPGAGRALLRGDDGLDLGCDAFRDLDLDHVRAGRLDRLAEQDLAAVEPQVAGLAHGVDHVLRGHRAEQPAVVARLVGDGE